ncbi:hypothetical protein [Nostoc sp.]
MTNPHTESHQAIYQPQSGSGTEAKQLLAQQIEILVNVLMLL